jgi:ferredoxin
VRAAVDDDRCRGHSLCWSVCPEVFSISDDGYAVVEFAEVPAQFEAAVKDAAANCPERAITLT